MSDRYKYRLQPCPSYDVEGMEAWLEDMAEEGLLLVRDGFMLGFGEFIAVKPDHKVRYRLVAQQKKRGLLNDHTVPEDGERELIEEFGWEFVTHRGDFYIYRTTRADAREMDTDPEVQALALNAVKKRQRANVIAFIIWWLFYPALLLGFNIIRTTIAVGTPFILFVLAVYVWCSVDAVREFVHIRRLYKKLKSGEPLERKRDWRRRAARHKILSALRNIAAVVCLVAVIIAPIVRAAQDGDLPVKDFDGELPFAPLSAYGEEYTPSDYDWSNDYRFWSDFLAPVNYEWSELGDLTLSDGSTVSISYDIEYHETAAPWLAQLLAREMRFFDWRSSRDGAVLDLPDLGADYAVAYRTRYAPEVVILVFDNIVVRAQFYPLQSSDGNIPLETWTQILADSLK